MGDEETRAKRGQQRRRDFHAKFMHEHLRPKVYDPRKQEYKRVKMNPLNIQEENENERTIGEDS